MKIILPERSLLKKTAEVDYFHWYYTFPISMVMRYRLKKIIQLMGNERYSNLLEVGIGSGIFLPELSRHCENLYAIDIHEEHDHIHKLCNHYDIKNYNLSTQNIENTNFPDNFFDTIVAASVLEFLEELDKAVGEIKRILKKDGLFITICPMESRFLDYLISLYSLKPAGEEFGESRIYVTTTLEENFSVLVRGYMMPLVGKYYPVYTHYKLKNAKH
jgi:ubiquinone/menaquinone biosynthesis C-methylase UbiE